MNRLGLAGRSLLGCVLFAGAACPAANAADNWTRFRGTDGNGIVESSSGFTGPLTEKDILWNVELPGVGHSSPVIWQGQVYLTAGEKDTAKRYVLCLDAQTGKTIWTYDDKFVTYKHHKDNSYASPTPTVDANGVYVVLSTPQDLLLLALDHKGKPRWKQSLGRFTSGHGSGSSPVVMGDMVVVNVDQEGGGDSTLFAFDAKAGKPRWKLPGEKSKKAGMSTPRLWKPANGPEQIVVATMGGGIRGIDPKNGQVIWSAPDVFFSRPIGSPQTTGDMVIAVNGEGQAQRELLAVKPTGKGGQPELVYKIKDVGPHVPTPIILGDRLLLWTDAGNLLSVDVNTGKINWKEKVGGAFYGSPVAVGDVLWAMNRDGELVGVNVADGYKPVGKLKLGEPSHATPAIVGDRMYLRTMSHLICVKAP